MTLQLRARQEKHAQLPLRLFSLGRMGVRLILRG